MYLIPVIQSGGVGARLRPLTGVEKPKPLLRLPNGKSLLQATFECAALIASSANSVPSEILTVANQKHLSATLAEFDVLEMPKLRYLIILESEAKDTAAAVIFAALTAQQLHGKNVVLFVMPADHVIEDTQVFIKTAKAATLAARRALEF